MAFHLKNSMLHFNCGFLILGPRIYVQPYIHSEHEAIQPASCALPMSLLQNKNASCQNIKKK